MIKHSFFRPQDSAEIQERVRRIRLHAPAAVFLVVIVMAFYYASIVVPPGWLTFTISFVCLSIVGFTALARLDDIGGGQTSKRWQVRRAGLVMVVAGAGMIVLGPMTTTALRGAAFHFPSWSEVMLYVGVTLTWITTPHMPPWWRYITGKYKTVAEAKLAAVADIISGLDPREDAPQYTQGETLPVDVPYERRTGIDRREQGP